MAPTTPVIGSRLKLALELVGIAGVVVAAGALIVQIAQYRDQVGEWDADRVVRRQTLINLAWANITRSIDAEAVGEQGQIEALQLLLGELRVSGIGADLRKGYFAGLDLSTSPNASLAYAKLDDATLIDAKMPRVPLGGASLTGARMGGADISGADAGPINAYDANLSEIHAAGAQLGSSNFTNAFFGAAILQDAKLVGANLWGAEFYEGAKLGGANLSQSLLVGIGLEGADLAGVRFDGAIVNGARFSADFDAARLAGACYYEAGVRLRIVRGAPATSGSLELVEELRADGPPLIGANPTPVTACVRDQALYYGFTDWPMTYRDDDPALERWLAAIQK